ncbi:MAG: hypothetical protein ACW98I_02955 [Candidatus Hodarchaeales archaeon]|jgi:hypothetical protein
MYEEKLNVKFERYAISATALIVAGALTLLAILGPLGLDIIKHRSSQSAMYQIQGQDLVNLLLLAPLSLIGGVLYFRKNENAKYFLILVGIYTFLYTGLAYGIGQEWSMYDGNVEDYFWLFYILIIGGLLIFISSFSMFNETDAPEFNRKSLRVYIGLMVIFLAMFSMMWIQEILEVVTTGDTSTGSYLETPNMFWVIRYFDLGITLPLGFIGLYLLGTRPKKAYPIVLAFYGFFVTISTAVVAMAVVMVLSNDPLVRTEGLIIFPILCLLSWAGFFYLIKAKLPWFN